jgi:hypothetical protein
LHPNAEFTVGPLTFRVDYEYAGEVAVEPDATTINETHRPPQPATGAAAGDFEVVDQRQDSARAQAMGPDGETPAVDEEPAAGQRRPEPADALPTIAPPDGQLPDFSAWRAEDTEEEQPQAQEPLPPPPAFFANGPPPEDAAPEISQGEPPEAATSAVPAPTISPPETTAFESGELAEIGQTQEPTVEVAESDQPREAPGVEAAESEAPLTQQSSGAGDEETKESTVGPEPEADEAPEEGMFDLSVPPAAETEESDDVVTGDKELDDFLKGLG